MKLLFTAIFVLLIPVLAKAQSGIGLPPYDADVAFHIKKGSFDHGLRVDGLVDDPTDMLTDVVVRDANGVLYYRPITDLTVSGEWIDHPTLPYIFANQANAAGNDVVVMDSGNLGIGTTNPRNSIEVNSGLIIGTGVQGAYSTGEDIRFAGGTTSDAIITTQDGSGRWSFKWNATNGNNERFLTTGDYASKMLINGDPNLGADVFRIDHSTVPATAGNPITWRTAFNIENNGDVGIGTNGPTTQLDVNGQARVRILPDMVFTGVATADGYLVTAEDDGTMGRVRPSDLFDKEGEWMYQQAGGRSFIYARRAQEENGQDVVIDEFGRIGVGRTQPEDKIHLTNGGMRIDGAFGIGFAGELPYAADPLVDGSRIYSDPQGFGGGNRDALVIEKTDDPGQGASGGILFANRSVGNTRTISMSIGTTGNVGIGLANPFIPQEKFHLLGDALVQRGGIGNSSVGGVVRTGDPGAALTWANNGFQARDVNDFAYFGLRQNGAHRDGVVLWGSSATSLGNNAQKEDFRFIHTRNGVETEAMRIDGFTKNVGIGTVPATNMKLDVNGRVRVRSLPVGTVGPTGSTDFVVTANANGELFQVDPNDLVNTVQDLDWTILGDRIYNSNSGTVGIGLANPDVGIGLHVNGVTRLEGNSRLELENSNNYLYRNGNDNDVRFVNRTLFTFRGRGDAGDVLAINGDLQNVGIGTNAMDPAYKLDVAGDSRIREGSRFVFGDDPDNNIRSSGQNELTIQANERMVVRNRGGQDIITALRNRDVGIQTTAPTAALDIAGDLRIRTLPAGATGDDFLSVDVNGNVRKQPLATLEGPWDRTTAGVDRTFLRNVNDRVGIGTTSPVGTFHIYEANGTAADRRYGTLTLDHGNVGGESSIVFKSRSNFESDFGYISFQDDGSGNGSTNENALLTIGIGNDGSGAFQDDISLMPSGNVGIKTNAPTRELDINGNLRIRGLVSNTSDQFALTTDANGNVNQQAISSIKDNLGDHLMRDELVTDGFSISYDGTPNSGLMLTPQNNVYATGRLELGNVKGLGANGNNPLSWIDDAVISGFTDGMATNDGAIFIPVHQNGTENSDLRLYITDNSNDAFSIWGSPCPTDCGNINASSRVARFEAGGTITLDALGGTGTRMVVANANGVLSTQPIPNGNNGNGNGNGDNLGNHTATQELNLRSNWVRHNNANNRAFRIRNDGVMEMAADNAIRFEIWNNRLAQTPAGMELRSQNDIEIQAINNDMILTAADRIDITSNGNANADEIRLMTDGANERLVVQNDGEIEIADLAGTGSALVGVDANGVLERLSTNSDGLWNRDAGNNETFLRNLTDAVGIGTENPVAALHVSQALGALNNPLQLRLQNRTNNGGSEVFFQEGNNTGPGIKLSYDGTVNKFYTRQHDGIVYTTLERGKGDFGIGTDNPEVQLHVVRNTANGNSGSGLVNPARMRIQNETAEGSAAIELMEGAGNIGNNNGMSLRYNSAADGSSNAFEVVRGAAANANTGDVHLRIDRNTGQTTIQNLATGGAGEMVVADANGVLSTQALEANIWEYDVSTNRTTLSNATSSVGIGEPAPGAILDINGDLRIQTVNPGTAIDAILVRDLTGVVRQRPASAFANFFTRNGTGEIELADGTNRLGFGTSPAAGTRLHLGAGQFRVDDLSGVGTRIVTADANGTLQTDDASNYRNHWDRNAGTSEVSLANISDEVGVGIASPEAKLHVVGDVRISDLATGGGAEMVVADINGTLSIQPIAPELWTQSIVGGIGQTILTNSSDNVGIGVAVPAAKLDVQGDLRVATMITGTTSDELVVVGADGVLKKVPSGTYSNFWSRDVVNGETYLTNPNDNVGIGINDPLTELHIQTNDPANAAELRVQNRAVNGSAQIRLVERLNNLDNNSVLLRYNGSNNHFEITNGFVDAAPSFATYFTINRGNGLTTIGNAAQPGNTNLSVVGNSIFDGNINLADGHRIQFAEANSFLRDQSATAGGDDDVMLRAADILYLRGGDNQGIRINGNGTIRLEDVPNGGSGLNLMTISGAGDVRQIAASTYATNFGWRRTGTDVILSNNGDNVGIGITSGGDKLDVNGSARVRGALTIDDLAGGGNQMVVADNTGVLSVQALPTDTDDQNLTWNAGSTTLSIEDGNSVDLSSLLDNTDAQAMSYDGATGILTLVNGGTVDLSTSAIIDDQALSLVGDDLSITNGNTVDLSGYANTDAQAISLATDILSITGNASTVDLSGYLDNTDAQAMSYDGATGILTLVNGGTVNLSTSAIIDDQALSLVGDDLSITNGNTVDLSGYANTDAQAISLATDILSITGNASTVDLSGYLDNTDAQAMSYDGATGILTLVNGGTVDLSTSAIIDDQALSLVGDDLSITNGNTVDLSGYANTDAQAISLATDILSITGNASTVDLSGYLDNTDAQAISLASDILSITGNASTVDLSSYLDNTDAQALSYDGATGILTLVNGGTVDLSTSAIIDDQALSLVGDDLSITNGNTVDLSGYANTDAQAISLATDILSITGNASTVDLSGYLDNTDAQAISLASDILSITGNASTVDLSSYLDNTDAQALSYDGATGIITLANGGTVDLATSTIIDDQTLSLSGTELTIVNGNMVDLAPIGTLSTGWSLSGTDITLGGGATAVGIGTSPDIGLALHVNGNSSVDGVLTITSTGTDDPLRLENLQAYVGGSPYDILVVDSDGDVQVHNSATASDRRLKENIKPMEGTLDKLLGMESVTFTYRQDVADYAYPLDEETHYGVIAQQVQTAFPHAVIEKDGYLHIQEKELIGVLLAATKELTVKNAELAGLNTQLEKQVAEILKDKQALEKTVIGLRAETTDLHHSMAKVLDYIERDSEVQTGGK